MVEIKRQVETRLSEDDLCKRNFVLAVQDAINVVSGKWKLAIVCTLLSGAKHFSHIERLLPSISPRMLARELRELELNNVIERVAGDGHSRFMQYALTASGQRLEQVITMMASWGQEHRLTLSTSSSADGNATILDNPVPRSG